MREAPTRGRGSPGNDGAQPSNGGKLRDTMELDLMVAEEILDTTEPDLTTAEILLDTMEPDFVSYTRGISVRKTSQDEASKTSLDEAPQDLWTRQPKTSGRGSPQSTSSFDELGTSTIQDGNSKI